MTVQLSVEEALEFQKFESELRGFQAGIQSALDFSRRQKVQQIIDRRKPMQTESSKVVESGNGDIISVPSAGTTSESVSTEPEPKQSE